MIYLTNGVDYCKFERRPKEQKYRSDWPKYCIRINEMLIKEVDKKEFGNYALLEMVFDKFIRYNYKSFWRNPIYWLFGRRKTYSWDKIRHV